MLQTKVFSQQDARWGNDKMGASGLKVKSFGCTITCLTSLLCYLGYDETPKTVNAKLSANGGYYRKTALLLWGAVEKLWPRVSFVKRAYNYNNLEVASYVYVRRMPVMVEVNGYKIGTTRHWVLFLGSAKMMDPWTGKISPTNTYPLTGYSLYSKK